MSKILSYAQFLKDRQEFRKSGSSHGSEFNYYDTPSHKYFKILFYFGDSSYTSNKDGLSNGLLHPTWEIFGNKSESELDMIGLQYYNYNSAWSYLKLNDENERAEKLEQFVNLLANINSNSPWYFNAISGLDSALERKSAESGNMEIEDPKKLTITCLPDSFDNRIGTLLELYRDITWSWVHKKEIIPANLRKFDMAVYIFESPLSYWHDIENDTLDGKNRYVPSYKMIEFHDCEFNYNSIKSGWGDVNNQDGISPTYTIEISYNDCYEISYNEIMMRSIGDVITTDTYQAIINEHGIVKNADVESVAQKDSLIQLNGIEYRNNLSSMDSSGLNQIAGAIKSDVKHLIRKGFLGNLYTYSLPKIGSQIEDVKQGNLIKVGQSVKDYIESAQQRYASKSKTKTSLGNLYVKNTIASNI